MTDISLSDKIKKILKTSLPLLKRNIIRPNATIGSVGMVLHSENKDNIYLTSKGKRIFDELLEAICSLEHPGSQTFLERIHPQSIIHEKIDAFLLNAGDVSQLAEILASEIEFNWIVLIAIEKIHFEGPIDLHLGILHSNTQLIDWIPKQVFKDKYANQVLISNLWLEVKVKSYNRHSALMKAHEQCRLILSFLGQCDESSIHLKTIEIKNLYFIKNIEKDETSMSILNNQRGISFYPDSEEDQTHLITVQRLFEELSTFSLEMRDLITRASSQLYRSQITSDLSLKLVLLTSSVETLLMEKFYRGEHTNEFIRRLKVKTGKEYQKVKFLSEIYKKRSLFLHSSREKEIRLKHYQYLEDFIHRTIVDLLHTKKTTHIEALEAMGLVKKT